MKGLKLTAALLACGLCACQSGARPTKETSQWWSHVSVLASDRLQGRLTGSDGYAEAVKYVAGNFQALGLDPAGGDGYLQSVSYEVQTILPEGSSLELIEPSGRRTPFALGDDMVLAANVQQLPEVTAKLEFIGYGLCLPEAGIDDFAGIDLKGKIAVYIAGAPAGISGPLQAYARAEALGRALEAAGAIGAIAVQTPRALEVPWERIKLAALQPGMYLSEPELRRFRQPAFVGFANPNWGARLFEGAITGYQTLALMAEAHQRLPHFPLDLTLSARISADHAVIKADNVIAELPGSDPVLAGQAVVLSAHLDHLGTGQPDHGDGIFHGAMDNASGVASLLEIARALQADGDRPKRSILFVAVGGEEKGLLGSRYFAAHPTRHAGELVADINMDMFLPLFPLRRMVAYGAEESSLGRDADSVARARALAIVPDPAPDHLVFVRSDQYSFIRRGVPALSFEFAALPGSADAEVQDNWFKERYHAQSDDLQQPVDLAAVEDFDRYIAALVGRIANAGQPPRWNENSFFRRFAATPFK